MPEAPGRGVESMRRAYARTLALALAMALGFVMASPGLAFGAGTISGTVREAGTSNPVWRARIGLYEKTATGLIQVGGKMSNSGGAYSAMTAADANTGLYVARTGRPGYITLDRTSALPIIGATVYDPVLQPDPLLTERTSADDRYSTAVSVARERFTSPQNPKGWWGVDTIVIASGEDRAAADPLASAALCGAYGDTPLFLVSSTMVPSSVKQAVAEISATYGQPIRVVVVGGPASVPNARLTEIANAASYGVIPDRLIATGDRFDLAAAIAERIAAVRGVREEAFIANGADPDKFFDALALSTAAASADIPILLVTENSIPAATRNALDQLGGSKDIFIGGGPATVSNSLMSQLDQQYGTVERWSGSDRYRTAQVIADKSIANGLLADDLVGVAAKLPDALAGGATIGQSGGVLLLTNGETLTASTGSWLTGHKAAIDKCYVIGGPVSVTDGVKSSINSKLQ